MFNSYIIPRLRNRTMKIRVHDVVFLEKTLFFPCLDVTISQASLERCLIISTDISCMIYCLSFIIFTLWQPVSDPIPFFRVLILYL